MRGRFVQALQSSLFILTEFLEVQWPELFIFNTSVVCPNMLKVLKWTLYDICPENIGKLNYKMDFSEQIFVCKERKNWRNLEISVLSFFIRNNIFCHEECHENGHVMLCVWTNRNIEFYILPRVVLVCEMFYNKKAFPSSARWPSFWQYRLYGEQVRAKLDMFKQAGGGCLYNNCVSWGFPFKVRSKLNKFEFVGPLGGGETMARAGTLQCVCVWGGVLYRDPSLWTDRHDWKHSLCRCVGRR